MGRYCAASIATSWESYRQGEGEWGARARIRRASEQRGVVVLAIKMILDTVNGRIHIWLDRWYNHLLVSTLTLVLRPLHRSLHNIGFFVKLIHIATRQELFLSSCSLLPLAPL